MAKGHATKQNFTNQAEFVLQRYQNRPLLMHGMAGNHSGKPNIFSAAQP